MTQKPPLTDVLDEVRFWAQVMGDAKRTVICPPDLESRIKGWVDSRGMDGIITVRAERYCPENKVIVMDDPAIEATMREWAQRPPRFRWTP